MTIVFFVPLSAIAFFEASWTQTSWMIHWLNGEDEIDFDNPTIINPVVEGPEEEHGLQISKVPFDKLVRKFPNTAQVCFRVCAIYCRSLDDPTQSTEATILKELSDIQESLHVLSEQIHQLRTSV